MEGFPERKYDEQKPGEKSNFNLLKGEQLVAWDLQRADRGPVNWIGMI